MDLNKIDKNTIKTDSGCFEWCKSTSSSGYGQLTQDGRYWAAHRYVWASMHGEIPKGKVIRHLCHNKRCCNIDHLRIGTHKDNYKDSKKTHKIAQEKRRHLWKIGESQYSTCREAVSATGISMGSVVKFTKDGVFNIPAYRKSTIKAGWKPKL